MNRLKATVERIQRLAGSYTDVILSIFPERVASLGAGLQIEEERIQVAPHCIACSCSRSYHPHPSDILSPSFLDESTHEQDFVLVSYIHV
jgi:hypothetical protein